MRFCGRCVTQRRTITFHASPGPVPGEAKTGQLQTARAHNALPWACPRGSKDWSATNGPRAQRSPLGLSQGKQRLISYNRPEGALRLADKSALPLGRAQWRRVVADALCCSWPVCASTGAGPVEATRGGALCRQTLHSCLRSEFTPASRKGNSETA